MNINPEDTETSVSKDNNISESLIQFTPTPVHHQQIITCRATNYKLQGTNNVSTYFLQYFLLKTITLFDER